MATVTSPAGAWSVRVACNLCGSRDIAARLTARRSGRRAARDRVLTWTGCDPFDLMVATARRPGEA